MGIKHKLEDITHYLTDKKYLEKDVRDYQNLAFQIFSKSNPVFVLSTGRCGTKLLTKLFEASKSGEVHHEPHPRMIYASRYVYERMEQGIEIRRSAFIGGRYELLKDAFLKNRVYIETNNQITFFADAIHSLLPNSRFIHLVRHPGDFVRSGIRRKYYNGHDYDDGRIVPANNEDWDSFSDIQKIGWLWNETNQVIENWKNDIPKDKIHSCKAEDLFSDPASFQSTCEFCELDSLDINQIDKIIRKPENVQRKGSFPIYSDWSDDQKNELTAVAPLGFTYGYFS